MPSFPLSDTSSPDTVPSARDGRRTDGANTAPFVRALRTALAEAVVDDPARRSLVERFFAGLAPDGHRDPRAATRQPACRHFERAMARAAAGDGPGATGAPAAGGPGRASAAAAANVARALAALEPSLAWYRRAGDGAASPDGFRTGHANAFVHGAGALDGERAAIGVTLLAPDLRYPDHRHPPEELYLVLSPGRWRHGDSDWFEPGIGGVVHNVPDVVHAMRSGGEPLLAIWCLLPVPR